MLSVKGISALRLVPFLFIAITLSLFLPSPVNPAEMEDYCIVPPYVTIGNIPPNILVMMDNAYITGYEAYGTEISADGIGNDNQNCESGEVCYPYDPNKTYEGYFKPTLFYTYNGNSWEPDNGIDNDPNGDGQPGIFYGNFMNWVTMSQYDLLQYVLLGGKSRSPQAVQVHTLVSKSNINWTKEYITNTPSIGDKCIFSKQGENLTITESAFGACPLLGEEPLDFAFNKTIEKVTAVASLSFFDRVKQIVKRFVNFVTDNFPSSAFAAQPPEITTSSPLPQAIQGVEYNATISAKFGRTPFTWSISSGIMPDGLILDTDGVGPRDTEISGITNDLPGIYTFTITVTDSDGNQDSKLFELEVVSVGAGDPRISPNYNIWVCAGDYKINCNNANAQVIDPDTGLFPPPCSPFDTSKCSLKYGIVQDFWDDARWGLQDFSPNETNAKIEKCIDPDPSNPVEGSDPDSDFLTAIENAIFVGSENNITHLVNGEYRAIEYFLANATQPQCGQKDPFAGDSVPCRRNFILMITAGEGADNPPNPNAGTPNVFSDSACDPYNYNLSKNACYGYINDLRSTILGKDDKPGKQNVFTYIVNAFGTNNQNILKQASVAGGGSGPIDGSGTENAYSQYFDASEGTELRAKILAAIRGILQRAASGTAASVLASGEGYGANIVQAVFYPRTQTTILGGLFGEEIAWVGRLKNYWYYIDPYFTNSSIREDTTEDKILNLTNDNIIQMFFDSSEERTKAYRWIDSDGDGDADSEATPYEVFFETLSTLWEAGTALWQRDATQGSPTRDKRKIYTTIDGSSFLTGNFSADTDNNDVDNSAALKPYFGLSTTDSDLDGFQDGDLDHDGDVDDTDASILIRYVHGEDFPSYTWLRSRTTSLDLNGDGDITDSGEEAKVWKLGDVINSTPRISSWLKLNAYDEIYNDDSYEKFYNDLLDDGSPNPSPVYTNRGMVFTGSNDGILHAFKLGRLTVYDDDESPIKAQLTNTDPSTPLGYEVWSFIPKNALPYLKYLTENDYCHLYFTDLPPYLFDASIGEKSEGDISNDVRTVSSWRTILIGGMNYGGSCRASNTACNDVSGDGEKDCVNAPGVDLNGEGESTLGLSSYFAIDITDQNNPELLWEFTHENLGFTTTGPAVVRIGEDNKNGKWFVIFGSGPTGPIDTTTQQFLGRSDQSLKFFILDLKTGTLLRTIDTGIEYAFAGNMINVSNDSDLNYQDDAVYISYVKRTSSAPYLWTKGGILRLVTKEDPNPNNWAWSKVIDDIGPVTSSIAKLQNNNTEILWLFFGTGRYYYELGAEVDDSTGQRRLFAIKEPCFYVSGEKGYIDNTCSTTVNFADLTNVTDINDVPDDDTANNPTFKGWYINLDPAGSYTYPEGESSVTRDYWAERVLTNPIAILNGLVFFSTLKPYNDLCAYGGKTFLWATKYNTGGAGGALLKGKVIVQVSTGSIEHINLASAFTEAGGRKTTAIEGVPPSAQGMTILTSPPPIKRVVHIRER